MRFLIVPLVGFGLAFGPVVSASAEPVGEERIAALEARWVDLLARLDALDKQTTQAAPKPATTATPQAAPKPSPEPSTPATDTPATSNRYDDTVTADEPAFFMTEPGVDAAGKTEVTTHGTVGVSDLPDGSKTAVFDGTPNSYLEVASSPATQVLPGKALTVEAWIARTGTGSGAADGAGPKAAILGVGKPGDHSWHWRLTGATQPDGSAAERADRLATYVFNPGGGLGSGSYVQPLPEGRPVHVVSVYDDTGAGTVTLYVDGVQADQDQFADYQIKPQAVNAPFRIGSANSESGFAGSIGKVATYTKPLTAEQVAAHYAAMTKP